MKRRTNHAITLLLLSALIVAGISVYYTRQEWREMYMRVMKEIAICRRSVRPPEECQTEAAGREANELAGVPSQGAASSSTESVPKLRCTIDPNEIMRKAGGGATYTFDVSP
jgi:hypothetical protein